MNRNPMWWARSSLILSLVAALPVSSVSADTINTDLIGVWQSQRIFGPAISGPVLIRKSADRLIAEVGGNRLEVSADDSNLAFSLPDGSRFEGELEPSGNIRGNWLQPHSKLDGNVFASPVRLRLAGDGWHGEVAPQPDTGTFYLLLSANDSRLEAEMINPERNLGVFDQLSTVVMDGDSVSIMGRFRGKGPERVIFRGAYYAEQDTLGLRYPWRGGAYDFSRVESKSEAGYLARASTSDLLFSPPPDLGDGWEVTTPAEVGIDGKLIEGLISSVMLKPPTSTHDLSIHALLIARHGKLVIEEYFHGFHRNLPHDSRSASKGVTAILAAAAMQSSAGLEWDTPVYPLFDTDDLLAKEPERRDITLRHLVNMNTGLDCDDRNPESAANEDYLWDHASKLDFYEHTINVDVVRAPGQVAKYCSASANLAGGVIAAATKQNLLRTIDRLVAEPMDIKRYAVPTSPDGHPFMGGGIRWLPRDFLKFPQLLLDDGNWNGRRILSSKNARLLITPAVKIDNGRDYGYLWYTVDYPYRDRTVRAHFMGGNGGQIAMLVPELQLSIVFNAGNYGDRVMFRIQEELIPNFILPAIMD